MTHAPHVGLLVTCLADLFRPEVGFAALKLLRDAGCSVSVPRVQTCCGQPAHNSGDPAGARGPAALLVKAFAPYDYVVAPSGSCAGMVRLHYADLFPQGDPLHDAAAALAAKTWELTSFLTDVMKVTRTGAAFADSVTYHDSCSARRELGVHAQPRTLLDGVEGLTLKECADHASCCGFGGTFCVKYTDISTRMADDRLAGFADTGARVLTGGDLGCLLHMAGRLRRQGSDLQVRHVAEILAGMGDAPPLGEEGPGA